MANGFIQVPADSTGKKIQTFENTVGLNTVEAEAVVLVDSTGANACNVNGSGQLPVSVANTPSVNQGTSPWLTRITDGTNPITQTYNANSSGAEWIQGVTLRKITAGASTELGSSGTPVRVDPTGTTTQPVSGTVTANQGGAPWSDNVTQFGGTNLSTGTGAGGAGIPRVTVSNDSNVLATQSGTWTVGSNSATGSAVPANAFYESGIAKTALPAAASDGNLTGVMVDKFGRQVCLIGSIRDLTGTQTTTISASTSETTIVTAGAAGIFNDLVMLIVSNTSASTNTRIDFRDATAGSVLFSLFSVGGAAPVGFALPIPIPQTTAANNWTAQCAVSTTDVRIYAVFVKNK